MEELVRRITSIWLGCLLIGAIPQTASSNTVTLVNSFGESVEFEVEKTDRFFDVLDNIQSYFQEDILLKQEHQEFETSDLPYEKTPLSDPQLDFVVSYAGITARSKKSNWRDYKVPVEKEEKKDIAYIVTTLANDSLISIGTSRSSLKKAGDRINHLHPYRFLESIFGSEKLKSGIHAIRQRGGWIWSEFLDGIIGSLSEEATRKNLVQFTTDFAKKVKIELQLILPSLEKEKWGDFVNILIDKIPRENDPNRYDM
jgi:hypothetical protein